MSTIDAATLRLKRKHWMRRLRMATKMLDKIDRQEAKLQTPIVPVKAGVAIIPVGQFNQTVAAPVEDDCKIPTFLQRQANAADEVAKAEILSGQEAAKAAKTKARIAKLKADKAGDRKKMPLQGKDALKAIYA